MTKQLLNKLTSMALVLSMVLSLVVPAAGAEYTPESVDAPVSQVYEAADQKSDAPAPAKPAKEMPEAVVAPKESESPAPADAPEQALPEAPELPEELPAPEPAAPAEEPAEDLPEEAPEGEEPAPEALPEELPEAPEEEEQVVAPEEEEELPYRTLTVQASRLPVTDENQNPVESILWSSTMWNRLYGRIPEFSSRNDSVTVEITGSMPETVTAQARFVGFAEEETHPEVALFLLEVELRYPDGTPYVSKDELQVTVASEGLLRAALDGKAFLAYSDGAYDGTGREGDVSVRGDFSVRSEWLAYTENEYTEPIRFRTAGLLDTTVLGTVKFTEAASRFRFLLSGQQGLRNLNAKTESGTAVTVTGPFSGSVFLQADAAADIPAGLEGETIAAVNLSLTDINGTSFQPETAVTVTLSDPTIAEAVQNGTEPTVWSVTADGTAVPVNDPYFYGDSVVFSAKEVISFFVTVPTSAEPEKKEEEKSSGRTLTVTDGVSYEVKVTVPTDADVPENAELSVSELAEGTAEYEEYVQKTAEALGKEAKHFAFAHAFDINLTDPKTGEHCQPSKPVGVSIRLLNEDIVPGDKVDVVHFKTVDQTAGAGVFSASSDSSRRTIRKNTASVEAEVLGAAVAGEGISFVSDSFSVYVVTQTALLKSFIFVNDTDGRMTLDPDNRVNYIYSQQVLINGESVVEPAMPSRTDAVFSHWAAQPNGTAAVAFPEPVSINKNNLDGQNNTTIPVSDPDQGLTQQDMQAWLDSNPVYYYAVYGNSKFLITFYNQSGLVVEKKEFNKPAGGSSVFDTRDVKYIPIQDKEGVVIIFRYWVTQPDGTGDEVCVNGETELKKTDTGYQAGKITITGDSPASIDLYPHNDDGHYIYFESNRNAYSLSSVDYISPATIVNGEYDDVAESADAAVAALNAVSNHCIPTAPGYTFTGWYLRAAESAGDVPVFKPNAAGTALEVNADEYAKLLNRFHNLPNNPKLYAHWRINSTADYTVVIWREKLPDPYDTTKTEGAPYNQSAPKKYVFAESIVIHDASTAGPVALADYSHRAPDDTSGDTTNEYYGFHYNAAASDTSVTVSPDGSTVANVYYDRDLLTLRFGTGTSTEYVYTETTSSNSQQSTQYGYWNGQYQRIYWRKNAWRQSNSNNGTVYNGTRYLRSERTVVNNPVFSITEPYGRNIAKIFPIHGTNGITYNQGQRWKPQTPQTTYSGQTLTRFSEVLVYLDTVPIVNVDFVLNTSNNSTKTLDYYVQILPGETADVTRDGIGYTLYHHTAANYGYFTEDEDFLDITGFTKNGTDPLSPWGQGSSATSIKAYYLRNKYGLNFHVNYPAGATFPSGASADYTEQVFYEQSLAGYESYFSPAAPNGYMFAGWYMDAAGSVKFFFSEPTEAQISDADGNYTTQTDMPANDIQLYAKWTPIKNRVVLIPNGGDMGGGGVQFHPDPNDDNDKFIKLVPVTRDYVQISTGNGEYDYDAVRGAYSLTAENEGDFISKPGAYIFQGWYQVPFADGAQRALVEYKPGKFAYAYGSYQRIADGAADPYTSNRYAQNSDGSYSLAADGEFVFVNAAPKKNGSAYSIGASPFNTSTPVTAPMMLVAMWQRAGGFRVEYNVKDPALPGLDYSKVTAPVDSDEYIDSSHARVLPAVSAPKGYVLQYWTDQNGAQYKPNELILINEDNAVLVGSDMVVKLTAHYRTYTPSERDMADYTFMTNLAFDSSGAVTGFASAYSEYEIQRISVNEELKAPITPAAPSGYAFRGWYLDKEGTRKFDGFGVITNPTYTTIYAVFDKVFTVTYHLTKINDDGTFSTTSTVIATQTYRNVPGDYQRLDTRRVLHPVDMDHYVDMWVTDWSHQGDSAADKAYQHHYNSVSAKYVDGSSAWVADANGVYHLYAVLRQREYVKFDSQGGSFVAQQEVPANSWPVRPDNPERRGFKFAGWFSKPEGGTEYEFNDKLQTKLGTEYDGTLYAHWTPDGSVQGSLTIMWWAQEANRPVDDTEAADPRFFQLLCTRQIDATFGTYVRSQYDTPQASNGLGLPSGWNNIVSVMTWADGQGIESAQNFIANAGGVIGNLGRYYEFKESLPNAVDTRVTVDESGNATLNVRFVLKKYTFKFNAVRNAANYHNGTVGHNASVKIHVEGTEKTGDSYQFPVWLGRDIAKMWPIDDATRRNAHVDASEGVEAADPEGAWVEVLSGTYTGFGGWEENMGDSIGKKPLASLQPSADLDKINKAFLNNGIYEVICRGNAGTNPVTLHYMAWNESISQYNELMDLREDTLRGTVTVNNAACSMNYDTSIGPKSVAFHENVNDQGGEPNPTRNHNYWDGKYVSAHVVARTGSQVIDHYEKVYKYHIADAYKNYTFYQHRNNFNALHEIHFIPGSGDTFNPPDVDGKNLTGFSRKENNYSLEYGGLIRHTLPTNSTIYYIDEHGVKWQMSYQYFIQNVIVRDEETYHWRETSQNTSGYDFYFYYQPLKYTLTLFESGYAQGAPTWSGLVTYGTMLNGNGLLSQHTPTMTPPAGTRFRGWSITQSAQSVDLAYTSNDGKMPGYNLTLYAIWEPITYTVTTVGVAEDGTIFSANDQGLEIDEDGNLVEGGKESAFYVAKYNQELQELRIENPKVPGELFEAWINVKNDARVSAIYPITGDLFIRPKFNKLETRTVSYDANIPTGLTGSGTAPTDGNAYVLGSKFVIQDGKDLKITRKDVDDQEYTAPFAYWVDNEGNRYYPHSEITFSEDTPGVVEVTETVDDGNGGTTTVKKKVLQLKAIYSEYRETVLLYNKNTTDTGAKFVLDNSSGADYTGTLPIPGSTTGETYEVKFVNGQVRVLYRDELDKNFKQGLDMIPNQVFPIGQDQRGTKFTVTRTDAVGNVIPLRGWATEDVATTVKAENGDKAYVNTIKDENGVLRNTLYAVWGICKVVDKNGVEHLFDSIQKAVDFIANNGKVTSTIFGELQLGAITNQTGTIEMLIDYKKPESDSPLDSEAKPTGSVTIPSGCTITLTTAKSLSEASDDDGISYYYKPSHNASAGDVKCAIITRAESGNSMFVNNGTFTVKDIIVDGALTSSKTCSSNGGIVNVNAGGTLNIKSGATLRNSCVISTNNSGTPTTHSGGAVYVAGGGTVNLTGGTITGNRATGNGAGIYLAEDEINSTYTHGILNIEGDPSFGGTGVSNGTLDTSVGNFTVELEDGKTNGGMAYGKARQDIFIAGYIGTVEESNATVPKKADSLRVVGMLTDPADNTKTMPMPAGSIWVWAEIPSSTDENNHYEQLKQFAKLTPVTVLTDDQKTAAMKAFRNAVPDDLTGASEVLLGEFSDDDTATTKVDIYWSGVKGSRKVILRKVAKDSYDSLENAVFVVYKGSATSPFVLTHKDKTTKEQLGGTTKLEYATVLSEMKSMESGVFWIGELPYGTYYLHETAAPDNRTGYSANVGKWFCLIVDETGAYMSGKGYGDDEAYPNTDPVKKGKEAALTDATAVRTAIVGP